MWAQELCSVLFDYMLVVWAAVPVSYVPCSCYVKWLEGIGLGKPCRESLPAHRASVLCPYWSNLCRAAARRQYRWGKSALPWPIAGRHFHTGLSGLLGLDLWSICSFIFSFCCNSIFSSWPSACGKFLFYFLFVLEQCWHGFVAHKWCNMEKSKLSVVTEALKSGGARGTRRCTGTGCHWGCKQLGCGCAKKCRPPELGKTGFNNQVIVPNIHKENHVVNLDVTQSCKLMWKDKKKIKGSDLILERGRRNHQHEHLIPVKDWRCWHLSKYFPGWRTQRSREGQT